MEGVRRDGAHAAGVRADVAVLRPLMVHAGDHGLHGGAVGEGKHGNFRAFEVFLDDDPVAAFAELFVLHDLPHSFPGVPAVHGHGHALAQGQAVRLDHRRDRRSLKVFQGLFRVSEDLVGRGGNAVFLHQVLGEDLAALDDGGVRAGTEAGDALLFQRVHTAQHQRIVRCDNSVIDLRAAGESDDAFDVRRLHVDADSVRRDTAVARQGVDRLHGGILLQFFDDRMLAAATADD